LDFRALSRAPTLPLDRAGQILELFELFGRERWPHLGKGFGAKDGEFGVEFGGRQRFLPERVFIEFLGQAGLEDVFAGSAEFFFEVAHFFALGFHGLAQGSALLVG